MNEFDALGPICIVTDTGIICMESPLKWHLPYHHNCVDEPEARDPGKAAARASLIEAIAGVLDTSPIGSSPHTMAHDQHLHIAAIAVYLNEVSRVFAPDKHFDPRQAFTMVKAAKKEFAG